jgi:mono/diheme cytochrome c family protein
MSFSSSTPKYVVLAVLLLGAGLWGWQLVPPTRAPVVGVNEPTLSDLATLGRTAFEANCATCHGLKAAGTAKGPPLVHDIYNPGHHADLSFFLAAKKGVRAHHWPYGNMPPQPQVNDEQLKAIVQYVRELQAANGITYRPHNM